ncbi:hypothetical protein ACSQ67_022619 [Phaseolus vulgaris]
MGSRVRGRVVQFANLPIKLLMPKTFTNIHEIALKTIPSASKIEIKRVLESLYGFEVEKVQTLNMEGKKKKRGGVLIAKPDYKKPMSLSRTRSPFRPISTRSESSRRIRRGSTSKPSPASSRKRPMPVLTGSMTGRRPNSPSGPNRMDVSAAATRVPIMLSSPGPA